LVVAATGDFLKNLFYISASHIGFGQPVKGEEEISRHSARGAQFGPKKRIDESAKILHGGLGLFEDIHAGGGGHRIEHQVIVPSQGVTTKKTIIILKVWIKWENKGGASIYMKN
jgi:hypothetical protein